MSLCFQSNVEGTLQRLPLADTSALLQLRNGFVYLCVPKQMVKHQLTLHDQAVTKLPAPVFRAC